MLKLIIKKEILSNIRDPRIQISSIVLLTLLVTAVLVSKEGQKRIQHEREQAMAQMYDVWVNQGEKHPHSAAHYGQFVFKPTSVLSFLDTGIDPYTGVSIFLEAHRQNEVLYARAQESTNLIRFGELTAALIFQMLIPLLIIFLTFNSFSREREEGTLKLVHGQGLSMRTLLNGKLLGTYSIVLFLFIPVILISFFLLDRQSIAIDKQVYLKFVLIIIAYALYFFIFTQISVLVSAFSRNSAASLITLLGIWCLSCVIVPKAAADLAEKLYPAPSQFDFRNSIAEKVQNGIDGHNPSDERLSALREQVLSEYNVETIEELPVNWRGIALQAGEEYTDMVYDQEFSNVEQVFKNQNQVSEWVGFLNPYLATRNLTMGLAGTDYSHHLTFAKAAENYRREFVKVLNKDMELNHAPDIAYADYKLGKEFWQTIEPFEYEVPHVATTLNVHWRGSLGLFFWTIMLGLIASVYSNKIPKL